MTEIYYFYFDEEDVSSKVESVYEFMCVNIIVIVICMVERSSPLSEQHVH